MVNFGQEAGQCESGISHFIILMITFCYGAAFHPKGQSYEMKRENFCGALGCSLPLLMKILRAVYACVAVASECGVGRLIH